MAFNVIIIGSIDWAESWQMPQQLATSFAVDGNFVLYINNSGVRRPRLFKDLKRLARKAFESIVSTRGFHISNKSVTVLQKLLIPLPYNKWAIRMNTWSIVHSILKWYSISQSRRPTILITFLPTPLAYKIAATISPSLLIYYCANNMDAGQPEKSSLIPWERRLFEESDLVFTISDALFRKARSFNCAVHSFPPGLDSKFINTVRYSDNDQPDDLTSIPRPRIGYVGSLAPNSGALDLELIVFIAKTNPDLSFVLIGPIIGDISGIKAMKNIFILGAKPHSVIPCYLAFLDVALVPYKVNEFTLGVSSCKVNEYLSAGLPVVGTPLPELIKLHTYNQDLIYIASDYSGFSQTIRELSSEVKSKGSQCLKKARMEYALSNSWDTRYQEISQLIAGRLNTADLSIKKDLDAQRPLLEAFKQALAKEKKRILLGVTGGMFVYFLLFVSPLFSIVGYYLAPRDPFGSSNTVVVLTGDGAGSYHNDSFLLRSADILDAYSKNKDINIIISTARHRLVSEVSVMKAYLESKGISPEKISILEPDVSSTWEHISYISNFIPNEEKSIALLSAPFHARRAAAMMRRQRAFNGYVVAPSVRDTPKEWSEWMPPVYRIRVIVYELASLAYAHILGRYKS